MPLSNVRAMEQIHSLLQGLRPETEHDVISEITQIVRDTGREIELPTEELWVVVNLNDAYVAYEFDTARWLTVDEATVVRANDREEFIVPRHGFWMLADDARGMGERSAGNLRSALQGVDQQRAQSVIHDWRWLAPDEREANDMRVEIDWASSPTNPDSLTLQYNLGELNQLRLDLGRIRVSRPVRDLYRGEWGIHVGDRLARREVVREVAMPATRMEGEWTPAEIFEPQFMAPAFYEEGQIVLLASHGDTEIRIQRTGYAMAYGPSTDGTGGRREISQPTQFREQFPDGNIDWDMYDSPRFIMKRKDANSDGWLQEDGDWYDLHSAILRASEILRVRNIDPTELTREDEA